METLNNKTTPQGQKDSMSSDNPKLGDLEELKELCEIHGEFTSTRLRLSDTWTSWSECPECESMREQEQNDKEAEVERIEKEKKKQERIEKLFDRASIPKRYKDYSFETYKVYDDSTEKIKSKCQDYAENFPENYKLGKSIIMCGTTGTGKTHISCAIANHIIKEHARTAVFTTVAEAIRRVKETYSRTNEITEQEAINNFCEPDLVIFDEVGVQFGSDTEKNIFFEIINKRYEEMKPSILLSNFNIEGLKQFVGDRVIDRLRENGGILLTFNMKSYRK